mgnify:CR=1 FL=1
MKFTFEEKENIKKIQHHMNENHLSEDGEAEKEWTENDVIYVALRIGLEHIMRNHKLK